MSSDISQYSAISTLERQYMQPLGHRNYLFVKSKLVVEGGIEGHLKRMGQRQDNQNGVSLQQSSSANVAQAQGDMTFVDGASADETSPGDDPFAFLHETTNETNAGGGSSKTNKPNLGRFLKNVAKKTSVSLERGMHGLAKRAEQGRNPDLLAVGCYSMPSDTLLGLTNWVPLSKDHIHHWSIPLVISRVNSQVMLKFWIKSGSTLLQKAAKNYLLASAPLQLPHMQQKQKTQFVRLPLISEQYVEVAVAPDLKFPPTCGDGWSLTDPLPNASLLFHPALDQSYLYAPQWLVGTERSIESAVVLPVAAAFAELASQACLHSLQHAQATVDQIQRDRHDTTAGNARARVAAIQVVSPDPAASEAQFVLYWQRPDCIFEVELTQWTRIPLRSAAPDAATPRIATVEFSPKLCRGEQILPSLRNQARQAAGNDWRLGNIRIVVQVPRTAGNANTPQPPWEGVFGLEAFCTSNSQEISHVPLYAGQELKGSLALSINVQPTPEPAVVPCYATGGLVSLVGFDPLVQGIQPYGFDLPETAATATEDNVLWQIRQQLATMGKFISHGYLEQHISANRMRDAHRLKRRAEQYRAALMSVPSSAAQVPPHQTKTPKPFRPSSSRAEELLSGIPFNVHVASFTLQALDQPETGAAFHNVTCGAPADHESFGCVFKKEGHLVCPIGSVSGGLRRLEAKRLELAGAAKNTLSLLTTNVANYFISARQQNPQAQIYHVPCTHSELQAYRWKAFEAMQAMHHLTWICAVRRANVFSQALGIAVSSYLTAVSDVARVQSGWPDLWVRHGYLVSYEGLLSAAGKELGMIEDASVGIAMLHMVKVSLLPDDGVDSSEPFRVPIMQAPYLKWVKLTASGQGSKTQYLLEVGVDRNYYAQRIPVRLQNRSVQFYPLLFQVGVDIRQWGANAGSNVKNTLNAGGVSEPVNTEGMVDGEDDDVGVADNDVLVALNYEALFKLNAYAHAVAPISQSLQDFNLDSAFAAAALSQSFLPVHPTLALLHSHIKSSAGRMNHSILDEAATIAQQMGGGGVVFCKSGKDRTAMHVTFKQAQFSNRFRLQYGGAGEDRTLEDATVMRIHGTRLPICEKNVGQAKYAFNSLQVQFMPDALKPPMNTLAGFLKGGRVFGQGGIES